MIEVVSPLLAPALLRLVTLMRGRAWERKETHYSGFMAGESRVGEWGVGATEEGKREEPKRRKGKKKVKSRAVKISSCFRSTSCSPYKKKKRLLAFDVDPRRGGDERRSGDERHRSRPLCSGAFRRRVGAGLLGLVSRRGGFPPGTPWGRLVARKVVKTPLS